MSDYRFYFLRPDNSIETVINHTLKDDLAALDHARKIGDGKPVEGWNGKRLVFRMTADGSSEA